MLLSPDPSGFRKNLITAMSLLLITFALHTPVNAEIKEATLHVRTFYCGNECAWKIKSIMDFYDDEIADININREERKVTVFPTHKKPLDLYELRKELRNAGYAPWKIEVVVTGEVTDFFKVYSGGELHARSTIRIEETGERFILKEGVQLDKIRNLGNEKVTVTGVVPAFIEKYLPLLVITEVRVANEETSDAKAKVDHLKLSRSRSQTTTKDS